MPPVADPTQDYSQNNPYMAKQAPVDGTGTGAGGGIAGGDGGDIAGPNTTLKQPDKPKNPYQSGDFTGYGPLEGTRWLKDQAQQQFATMSMTSNNPGLYVRQKFDIDKRIDGFGANLTLEDANHVWQNVFSPQFDGLKVRSIQDDYDSRGKALLDQIYAPVGHGDTKPTWDQIPKNERIAAAAYATVSALMGRGANALSALARPLTDQEQENVKKEAQAQQNEQIRRQGLVEQFKVLMGDKTQAVAAMEQRQREDALDNRQDDRLRNQNLLQDKRETEQNQRTLRTQFDTDMRSLKGPDQRLARVDQFEKDMSNLTGSQFKVEPSIRTSASQLTEPEKQAQARTQYIKDRDDQFKKLAQPNLEKAMNQARKSGIDADAAAYRLNNVLPWIAQNDQAHYAKQMLDIDRLTNAKLNGWVTNAKGSTILKDASGKDILDAGGRPIRTVAEARAKVSDIDALLHQQTSELGQDLLRAGMDQQGAANLQGIIRDGLRQGKSVGEIEKAFASLPFVGEVGKDIISRAVAIEKMRADNQALRTKLGEAQAEPVIQIPAAPRGKSKGKSGFAPMKLNIPEGWGVQH